MQCLVVLSANSLSDESDSDWAIIGKFGATDGGETRNLCTCIMIRSLTCRYAIV